MSLLLTGSKSEKAQADRICQGNHAHSIAGLWNIEELAALISLSSLVISVNTGTIHIAAATGTPVIVLYAMTNPQHTPWKVPGKVLTFSVRQQLRSRNEVINYVSKVLYAQSSSFPGPCHIVEAAEKALIEQGIAIS